MEDIKEFWKNMWNEHANSESMFVQIGRSNFTPADFFLMNKEIVETLDIQPADIVLDAGGGCGWTSVYLAPFVEQVTLFDYAEKMIEKAKGIIRDYKNIRAFQDDILQMVNVSDIKYNKVIVGSVLQYLENNEQVEKTLENMFKVMHPGGKALFIHNPDERKKEAHIKSYDRLNWDKERIKRSLEMENKRLWLHIDEVSKMALKIGFSECVEVPVNSNTWESKLTFNFMVVK